MLRILMSGLGAGLFTYLDATIGKDGFGGLLGSWSINIWLYYQIIGEPLPMF